VAAVQDKLEQLATLVGRRTLFAIIGIVAAIVAGVLISQNLLIVAAGVLLLVGLMAVVISPDIATVLVTFIVYSNVAVVAVRFHGAPYILGAVVPLLLVFPVMHYLLHRREDIVIMPTTLLAIAYLLVQLVSALFSDNVTLAQAKLMTFISEGLLLFVLVTNAIRTPETLRYVIWALLAAGILLSIFPLYQQITGTFNNNYWGFAQAEGRGFSTGEETLFGEVRQPRLAGALGEKNFYAQIMLMLVPIGLFQFTAEKSRYLRGLALVATLLATAAAALTFSRGAAVGFMVMLILATLMRAIKPQQFVLIVALIAVVLIALPQYTIRMASLLEIRSFFQEDAATTVDGAIEGRATEMLSAIYMFRDHPIVGVGPGMSKYYSSDYGNALGIKQLAGTRRVHSLYLELLAEGGVLGFVTFMSMLGVTLFSLYRARKRWSSSRPEFASMIGGLMLALVTHMTTSIFLHMSYERYFWLMMAISVSAIHISRRLAAAEAPAPAERRDMATAGTPYGLLETG